MLGILSVHICSAWSYIRNCRSVFLLQVYRVKCGLVPNQFPTISNSIVSATQASLGSLFSRRFSNQQSLASLELDVRCTGRDEVPYTTTGADLSTLKCLTSKKVSFTNEHTILGESSRMDDLDSACVGANSVIANSVQFTVQLIKEQ